MVEESHSWSSCNAVIFLKKKFHLETGYGVELMIFLEKTLPIECLWFRTDGMRVPATGANCVSSRWAMDGESTFGAGPQARRPWCHMEAG